MHIPIKIEVITSTDISSSESPFLPLIFTQIVKVIQLQLSLLLSMALQRKKKVVCYYKDNIRKKLSQLLASRKDGNT